MLEVKEEHKSEQSRLLPVAQQQSQSKKSGSGCDGAGGGKKCDQQLMKYVTEVLQKTNTVKRSVEFINEHLKSNYAHIYPRINELSDKDLTLELNMAVREGILSRKFNYEADSNSSSPSSPSKSSSLVRLPADGGNDRRDPDTPVLLQLIIKSMARVNKQSFSTSIKLNKTAGTMCTLDELVKHMLDKNK